MAAITLNPGQFVPSANATIVDGIAAGAITRGQAVYLDPTSGKWNLHDADGATTEVKTFYGLACQDVTSNQRLEVVTKDPVLQLGLGLANTGDTLWNHPTAGAVTKTESDLTSGCQVYVLGNCTQGGTPTLFNLNPTRGGQKA